MESVAGPQLFQPWYSWRKPDSWIIPGIGAGEGVDVGLGVDVAVGSIGRIVGMRTGGGVDSGVGVLATVFSCCLGKKTTCSGGKRAYLILALNSSTRQAIRLLIGGRL